MGWDSKESLDIELTNKATMSPANIVHATFWAIWLHQNGVVFEQIAPFGKELAHSAIVFSEFGKFSS